jgi:hypothetical protein
MINELGDLCHIICKGDCRKTEHNSTRNYIHIILYVKEREQKNQEKGKQKEINILNFF